jgi:hypothetical protein
MGSHFTDISTSDAVTAANLNAVLEELGQAVSKTAVVSVTAGETLTTRNVVYISTGSGGGTAGRAYKTDADNAYSSSTGFVIGCATGNASAGAAVSVQIGGVVDGFSGLAAGSVYWLSATAGAIASSQPASNPYLIGIALSSTQLLLNTRGAQGAVS